MEFASNLMKSYGWKDGDGLGKNNDGIAKPLKATLKFDNAGFGADQAADDFNNHWWERVFNEAATNVNIIKEGNQIKMNLKDEDNSVEISTKGYSIKKLKKLKKKRGEGSSSRTKYENFLQAATLTNTGGEVDNPNKIDTSSIDISKINVLTDEELFKACGGRTAHKGARHGLKLSGKLSRIEQQESELLAKILAKRSGCIDAEQSKSKLEINSKSEISRKPCEILSVEDIKLSKKKRKFRKVGDAEMNTNIEVAVTSSKRKKSSKKDSKIEYIDGQKTSNIDHISKNSDNVGEKVVHKKKKNKRKYSKS